MDNLLVIFLNILVTLVTLFVFSYFKEKGKNQATKEDIGKITKIVESVKNELNQNLELMKIQESSLQSEKVKLYAHFTMLYLNMIVKKDNERKKAIKKFSDTYVETVMSLYYFSSDEVIKKIVDLIRESDENDPVGILYKIADLNKLMRIDLGNNESEVNRDDFLNLMLNDWEKKKREYGLS